MEQNYSEVIRGKKYWFGTDSCPVIDVGLIGNINFLRRYINSFHVFENSRHQMNWYLNPSSLDMMDIVLIFCADGYPSSIREYSCLMQASTISAPKILYGSLFTELFDRVGPTEIYDIRSDNFKANSYRRILQVSYRLRTKSQLWAEIRQKKLILSDRRCHLCGRKDDDAVFQAHHISYRNMGTLSETDDLVILCRDCHVHYAHRK